MNSIFVFGRNLIPGIFLFALMTFEELNNYPGGVVSAPWEIRQVKNNPPNVKITGPVNKAIHSLNTVIPYSIRVTDVEDGDSKYDEIRSDEVLLQVMFVQGPLKECDCYEQVIPEEPVGLSLLRNSDCFTCHQFRTKLIGPSFQEIARTYSSNPSAKSLLANRIKEGSMGVWGDILMPGHPDLSQEDANNITDWILQKGDKPELNYLVGKEGSLKLEIPAGSRKGYFLLRAMYTDKGLPDKPKEQLTGSDIIVVRYQ